MASINASKSSLALISPSPLVSYKLIASGEVAKASIMPSKFPPAISNFSAQ